MDVPRAAEPLYALPPSRFTAERSALVKDLAAKGDPAAAAVRKLRRPVGLAWALNRLARERPRDVEALVAAGERLRSGQRRALSGRGAADMRDAADELRERARDLRAAAERILAAEGKAPAPASLSRLELLLRVAAPVPGPTRDALVRGVLEREPEIASGELAGFAVLPGGRGAREAAAGGDAGGPRARDAAARRAPASEARLREARARAAREVRERQRAAARAERQARAAEAAALREERAAATAAARAVDARRRAADARAEAERLSARARETERPA